ncbi:unnamed protein product, partial [Tetraodon nigroviridis]
SLNPRLDREIGALACINLTGYVHINTLIICRAEARRGLRRGGDIQKGAT